MAQLVAQLSPLAVAPPPTIAHRRAAILPALRQATVTCPTPGCGCTVRADRVDRHLLRCPALATQRELSALGFYRPGLHAAAATTATLQTLSPDDAGLWRRLQIAHAAATPSLFHTPSTASLDVDGANERERHRQQLQRRSIASILADLGVLGRASCVVEVGAGNGELSLELARSVSGAASTDKFVLLDQASKPRGRKAGRRQAADAALRGQCHRVKVGIEDVDLGALRAAVAPETRGLVVVAKHLCGAATDIALRAAVHAEPRPVAIVLGSCCHHRCDVASFASPRGWLDGVGLHESDFGALTRLSSRGVNADDASARADAGRRAKDVLDLGRVAFLRSHGYRNARLVRYVDASVSPENVLVVATRD